MPNKIIPIRDGATTQTPYRKEIDIHTREAIRGHFDTETVGDYVKSGLSDAAGGAMFGLAGGAPGAAAGAIGGALWGLEGNLVGDITYKLYPVEKKIAWQAGDLQDTIDNQIVPSIANKNPKLAEALSFYGKSYKEFIDYHIRDKQTSPMSGNVISNQGVEENNKFPQSKVMPSTYVDQQTPFGGNDDSKSEEEALKILKLLGMNSMAKKKSKFIRLSKKQVESQIAPLVGGFAAPVAVNWMYDTGAKLLQGNKVMKNGINKAKSILKEISELSAELQPEFKNLIRQGGQVIYQIIDKLLSEDPSQSTQASPYASGNTVGQPSRFEQEINGGANGQ